MKLGGARIPEQDVPRIGAHTDDARELSLMIPRPHGANEAGDVGADRSCGDAAALGKVEGHDEEDRVSRGRQGYGV